MNILRKASLFLIPVLILTAAACSSAPAKTATIAGFWEDDASNVTTIKAQGDGFEAVTNYYMFASHSQNTLVSSTYANGVLTWSYCPPAKPCITMHSVSFKGDTLDVTWTDDKGGSGTMTLRRTDKGNPTDSGS